MQKFPHKKYFFPKVLDQNKSENKGQMQFYEIKNYQDLKLGKFNLLEPVGTIINRPINKNSNSQKISQDFDLIFIPALAVDKNKNRLGKGGGFYDRFLAKLKKENPENYKKLKKLTILPKFADLKKIPTEIYDKSVDKVILC